MRGCGRGRGEPYLIFPTQTRNGDNQVSAGKLIDIPNFFRLRQGRPDQAGEPILVKVNLKYQRR